MIEIREKGPPAAGKRGHPLSGSSYLLRCRNLASLLLNGYRWLFSVLTCSEGKGTGQWPKSVNLDGDAAGNLRRRMYRVSLRRCSTGSSPASLASIRKNLGGNTLGVSRSVLLVGFSMLPSKTTRPKELGW